MLCHQPTPWLCIRMNKRGSIVRNILEFIFMGQKKVVRTACFISLFVSILEPALLLDMAHFSPFISLLMWALECSKCQSVE